LNKTSSTAFLGLVAIVACLQTFAFASDFSQTESRVKTLVSVISIGDASEATLDPVVIVENGRFRAPFPEYDETAQKRFGREYFAPGKKYRVTFGGGEAGLVSIREAQIGCNSLHASGQAQVTANIHGRVMGLATDSDSIGKRTSSRRSPTDAERSAVMDQVKQIYRAKGTSASLVKLLTTTNLTATDLNGDGNYEFVGSFVIESPAKARRDLLLIAEPQGMSLKPSLIAFHSYKLPPEGFNSAVDFVDQLDIDSDGVAEVFVIEQGFDAYGYSIYKKQAGVWRKVYSAVGDAC
jgi:hypothetical protein